MKYNNHLTNYFRYEVIMSKPFALTNEELFLVQRYDCTSLSNGLNPTMVLWSNGLYWFYV